MRPRCVGFIFALIRVIRGHFLILREHLLPKYTYAVVDLTEPSSRFSSVAANSPMACTG